jgi:hypothetical protein
MARHRLRLRRQPEGAWPRHWLRSGKAGLTMHALPQVIPGQKQDTLLPDCVGQSKMQSPLTDSTAASARRNQVRRGKNRAVGEALGSFETDWAIAGSTVYSAVCVVLGRRHIRRNVVHGRRHIRHTCFLTGRLPPPPTPRLQAPGEGGPDSDCGCIAGWRPAFPEPRAHSHRKVLEAARRGAGGWGSA